MVSGSIPSPPARLHAVLKLFQIFANPWQKSHAGSKNWPWFCHTDETRITDNPLFWILQRWPRRHVVISCASLILCRVMSFAEYRRPHPHHRRPLLDGFDVVSAHAHGQFGKIFQPETLLTVVAQPPQTGETRANFLFGGLMGGDGHEAA